MNKLPIPFIDLEKTRVVTYRGLEWVVLPTVFPPFPSLDRIVGISARNIEMFRGKDVLDIGCGSGVRTILACMSGAKSVVASDISLAACKNTRINLIIHECLDVEVSHSDLFKNISGRFDCIVAYLPSIDRELEHVWQNSIYDPDFVIHKKLIQEAKKYLTKNGKVHLAFLESQENNLMKFIKKEGYRVVYEHKESNPSGNWIFVDISFTTTADYIKKSSCF
ncbi:MAG: class I SAM-dependent methyltransferase [Candidatus Pacebacteria bacterium]|nr:class I SAM-dependent methyltransferase [Candidatus Paceibacterota bacterium]